MKNSKESKGTYNIPTKGADEKGSYEPKKPSKPPKVKPPDPPPSEKKPSS